MILKYLVIAFFMIFITFIIAIQKDISRVGKIIVFSIFFIMTFGTVIALINGDKFVQTLKSNDTTQFSIIEQHNIPVELVDINNICIYKNRNTYNITYITKGDSEYIVQSIELDAIKIDSSKDSDYISTIQRKSNKVISVPRTETKTILIVNDENHFEELVNKSSISQQDKEIIKKIVGYNTN